MYTNAQKLASVLSEWMRPAISQIASSKIMGMPFMQSLQATILGSGLVGQNYNLAMDVEPMIQPIVHSLVTPMLNQYLSQVPDDAIPATARAIVNQMISQGAFSIMDGLITFDEQDIMELDSLLSKNLPIEEVETYQVIH